VAGQFGRFFVVGVVGTALDFVLLWLLLRLGIWSPAAVTIAYVSATVAQFAANRHWSFRNFDRGAMAQARTYAAVAGANLLVALAFVEIGNFVLGLPPLMAKALSIPPSVLVSFFGNRNLTFGRGIRATFGPYVFQGRPGKKLN
jgi:putative flippase GtrA